MKVKQQAQGEVPGDRRLEMTSCFFPSGSKPRPDSNTCCAPIYLFSVFISFIFGFITHVFFCSRTCFFFYALVRVHSLCWVKKWKHIADRAINEKPLASARSAPQQGRGVCVWLGVRPDSKDTETWETGRFGNRARQVFCSHESRTYKHIHFVSFHTTTWSATINTAGFPNPRKANAFLV